MKKQVYQYPQSSFLSLEKDASIIVDMILKNESLKKMIYHTSSDCLKKEKVDMDKTLQMFGKNIKFTPKLYIDKSVLNYINIRFMNFTENVTNPYFRDNIIEFDIICHYDQWHMKDFQLRPYRIAAELDSMFNNRHLTGIGTLEFLYCNQIIVNDEYGGVCLQYRTTHGDEDKKEMLNPEDEKQFIENFNILFNE